MVIVEVKRVLKHELTECSLPLEVRKTQAPRLRRESPPFYDGCQAGWLPLCVFSYFFPGFMTLT